MVRGEVEDRSEGNDAFDVHREAPPGGVTLVSSQPLTTHLANRIQQHPHHPPHHHHHHHHQDGSDAHNTGTLRRPPRPSAASTVRAERRDHHHDEGNTLRRKAFLDSIIAAQWRMVPLDIIAQPPVVAEDGWMHPHHGSVHRGGAPCPHRDEDLSSLPGVAARARLWWRRAVVEPLIHDVDDTSFDVWRKAVFAVCWSVCSIGIAVLLLAGLLSMVIEPEEELDHLQQEGYVTFLALSLVLNAVIYGIVRYTKQLKEWMFLLVHTSNVLGCYALCSLAGPRFASISVMMGSLFLMVWIMAVESPYVKLGGAAITYITSVLALLQSPEMLHFPKTSDEDPHEHTHNIIFSRTFLPMMTTLQSLQCIMCTSAFALMLFERHTSRAARAASHAIKEITRALVVDDYATVMELLTEFRNRGGADAVGGSSGAMLSMRFAAVAECMRTIRPYIPDHAFVQFDAAARRRTTATAAVVAPLLQPSHQEPSAPTSVRPDHQASFSPTASASRRATAFPHTVDPPHNAGHQVGLSATAMQQAGSELATDDGTDAAEEEALADAGAAASNLSSSTVTLVLLKYRGRFIAANTALLGAALQRIKQGNGIVEFVGYNYLLASFFGDSSEQAELTLRAVVELRALFFNAAAPSRPHATVSAHQGSGWVGLVKAPTRRWRFVGGVVVEALWRMPSVAQQTLACCIATERVVAPRHEWCCPIDVVAIDPEQRESVAEVIYEVHGYDSGTAAALGISDDGDFNRMFVETGIHAAVPSFEHNRETMFDVVQKLSQGRLRSAVNQMERHIRNPSRQLQRLQKGITSALNSRKKIYYKTWLGWGTTGTPAALHGASAEDSVLEHSGTSQMEDSQTSLAAAVAPAVAMARQDSLSVYDRVAGNLSERRRKIETMEKGEALFEMFVTPDSGEEIPSYITDNADRRWRRGQRTYGRGAFGWVFAATGVYGDIVAVKCVDLESRAISATAEEVSQEIHTLSELRHENIVGYIGHGLHAQYYFIIMESVPGGSLADLLAKFKTLPVAAVARYVRDALEGLKYLHKHEVVHCDIKPPNILITGRGRCKLSDFGSAVNLSRVRAARKRDASEDSRSQCVSVSHSRLAGAPVEVHPGDTGAAFASLQLPPVHALASLQTVGVGSRSGRSESPRESGDGEPDVPCEPLVAGCLYPANAPIPAASSSSTTSPPSRSATVSDGHAGDGALVARGTPHYMAPEACRNNGGMASDVWSLGITTYELLLGHMPWTKQFGSQQDAMFIRQLGNHTDPLSEIEWGSLEGLAAASPSSGRLCVQAEAFVRACLVVDPEQRPTVHELLKHPLFLDVM